MRKQRLLIWMTCLLLGGVSGCPSPAPPPCTTTSNPVPGNEDLDGTTGAPSNHDKQSVWADEGGILKFSSADPKATITVIFKKTDGTAANICTDSSTSTSTNTITGTGSATCNVIKGQDGNYTSEVTVMAQGVPGHPPKTKTQPPIQTYIRSCNNCQ